MSLGADAKLDFTELLDDLIAASRDIEPQVDDGPVPSLRGDLLDQIERLQAENVTLFRDRAIQEYDEYRARAPQKDRPPVLETPAHLQPALEDLFFLDPDSISKELGIQPKSKPEELDRARRSFAMRYHPDRVPEEFRERAVMRMQIANMLIDEAKRLKR
ncbi:hypothetical protein [Mesorhizobium sp. CAU 1732]|uniref:hypothetical protein n=1 Tax=Mesorhizobium sp. CAU 1732 TaxID=3140358 RepID=UPI003260F51D